MPTTYAKIAQVDLTPFQNLGSPRTPKLILPADIDELITTICKKIPDSEWLAFGFIEQVSPCEWVVTNLVIPDQSDCDPGNAEIHGPELQHLKTKFLREELERNPEMGNRFAWGNKLCFWVHSHHSMRAFWSATDHKAIEELGGHDLDGRNDETARHFFHLVVNNNGDRVAMFSTNRPFNLKVDLQVVVAQSYILRPDDREHLSMIAKAKTKIQEIFEHHKALFTKEVEALKNRINIELRAAQQPHEEEKTKAEMRISASRKVIEHACSEFADQTLNSIRKGKAAAQNSKIVQLPSTIVQRDGISIPSSKRHEFYRKDEEVSQDGELHIVGLQNLLAQEIPTVRKRVWECLEGDEVLVEAVKSLACPISPDPTPQQRAVLVEAGITNHRMALAIWATVQQYLDSVMPRQIPGTDILQE